MNDAVRQDLTDALRADAARLVQAVRHHLPARDVPGELMPMMEHVRHLAGLVEAGAPAEHLLEVAFAVVDSYDWPGPEASGSEESPVVDAAILAAVERLRDAADALDAADDSE